MGSKHVVMACAALALGTSLGASAQDFAGAPVVRGETIVVPAPKFAGAYVTEKDRDLLSDAMRALQADRHTRNAMLTIVADRGELRVTGSTTDAGQSARVVAKLEALPESPRVYAFLDAMSG